MRTTKFSYDEYKKGYPVITEDKHKCVKIIALNTEFKNVLGRIEGDDTIYEWKIDNGESLKEGVPNIILINESRLTPYEQCVRELIHRKYHSYWKDPDIQAFVHDLATLNEKYLANNLKSWNEEFNKNYPK